MTETLAMSFDWLTSPVIDFIPGKKIDNQGQVLSGYGFAWYPINSSAIQICKDAGSFESGIPKILHDWNRFRSSTFMSSILGSSSLAQQETQPFSRACGNREWAWMQAGKVSKQKIATLIAEEHQSFRPFGISDAEAAFCLILNRFKKEGGKDIDGIPFPHYLEWFNNLGVDANFFLTDGRHIIVFRGFNPLHPIYYIRRRPPHNIYKLESNLISVSFENYVDIHRTMVIFSSTPLSAEKWWEMEPGQMLVVRNANIQWNSNKKTQAPRYFNLNAQPSASAGDFILNYAENFNDFRSMKIRHETIYQYDVPIQNSEHTLRLTPICNCNQMLLKSDLSISVKHSHIEYHDVFDNKVHYITLSSPYRELIIVATSVVKVRKRPALFDGPVQFLPIIWMPWQRQMMQTYLLPPELPESQLRELSNFAMGIALCNDNQLIPTLMNINEIIYRDFEYTTGSTNLHTTVFEIYVNRRGVCQDFANLMICLARILGIPARYRVGYIYTRNNYENQLQSEASHAWAECFLPNIGWVGFDPTNGCTAGLDHILVACGRSYQDATPTLGTLYHGGKIEEKLIVNVRVTLDEDIE